MESRGCHLLHWAISLVLRFWQVKCHPNSQELAPIYVVWFHINLSHFTNGFAKEISTKAVHTHDGKIMQLDPKGFSNNLIFCYLVVAIQYLECWQIIINEPWSAIHHPLLVCVCSKCNYEYVLPHYSERCWFTESLDFSHCPSNGLLYDISICIDFSDQTKFPLHLILFRKIFPNYYCVLFLFIKV